ncbi:guanylate kinase [Wohlfahrtiimonas chitiniclastica]|nr:guanylate kinase [Wohlfahrtiimonas chitiniclastica]
MKKMCEREKFLGNLYVISSPSGGGKTTLVSQLLECTPDICRVVTHTTRAARPNEKDGMHYHFVTDEAFEALKAEGGFVETARVFNAQYGTSWKEVKSKLRHGMDVVLVIDWQGAEQVRISHPEAISIFILPPSLETLRARLFARNEDSIAVVENRMKDASNQISHYKDFDYLVVNDDFDLALANLRSIIMAERLKTAPQKERHKLLISSLLEQ